MTSFSYDALINWAQDVKNYDSILLHHTCQVIIWSFVWLCYRFDPQTNQWSSDVAPTSSCRTSVGVAVLDSYMYAVGGQDGVSCLNFVERYDPQLNKWTKVASMSTRRLGVGVAVLGGYLYAVGGSDGTSPLNTGMQYFT